MTAITNSARDTLEPGQRFHELGEATDQYLVTESHHTRPRYALYAARLANDFGIHPEDRGERSFDEEVWEACKLH